MQSIICSGNISTAQPPQARLGAGITLTLSEQQTPSLKNNNKSKVSTFVLRKPRSGPIHYMHWVSGALDTLHEERVQCSFSKTFYFQKSPIFPQGRFWWVLSFFQNKTPWTWTSRKSRHSQPVFANHFQILFHQLLLDSPSTVAHGITYRTKPFYQILFIFENKNIIVETTP